MALSLAISLNVGHLKSSLINSTLIIIPNCHKKKDNYAFRYIKSRLLTNHTSKIYYGSITPLPIINVNSQLIDTL